MLALPLEAARGLPRAYWSLWLGTLINRLGGFVVPFLALYLTKERGFTVERAGLVASLYGVGALCAGPIGGLLADRVGRRATMVLGLSLGALAMVHLGLARDVRHIEAAALILGLVGDLYRPAVWAAVSDLVPAADRARAYGLLYWAINLGFAAAAFLAGALASRGFWVLFLGDAATSLSMAAVIFAWVPETRPVRSAHERHEPVSPLVPFRDGVFLSFVALAFIIALVFLQHLATLSLDMTAHGLSEAQYGSLIAINGVLIVLLQPFSARTVQGHRRSRVLAFATLLVGLGFGAAALAGGWMVYAASIAVWTLGEILLSPVTPTIVADLAPLHLRGTYQGVQQMAWGAAFCLAPSIGTQILGRVGPRVLWLSCLALGLLASVGHLAIAPARRRRLTELHGRGVASD